MSLAHKQVHAPLADDGPQLSEQPARIRDDVETMALAALDRSDHRAALTVLMNAYGDEIYRYCRKLMADAELAEDVRQVTFVQAFEALPDFARRSSLRTWLYAIARHRCLDAIKGRRRFRKKFLLTNVPPEPVATASGHASSDAVYDATTTSATQECLDKLESEARVAVLLRYHDGLTYPDMSRVMGSRPATLHARVSRALTRLRRCLEAHGVLP